MEEGFAKALVTDSKVEERRPSPLTWAEFMAADHAKAKCLKGKSQGAKASLVKWALTA